MSDRFSRRFGFDPRLPKEPIIDDAPEGLRRAYMSEILDALTYIDGDSRYKNKEQRPLGIKHLIERLCVITLQDPDSEDYDSWYCADSLKNRILSCEWYQFFDFVELIGYEIRAIENQYESEFLWEDDEYPHFRFSGYKDSLNKLFIRERVGWRLDKEGHLQRALPKSLSSRLEKTDENLRDEFEPARQHYQKARKYALQPNPDPENSIKEMVSAIESIARTIYPRSTTLGDALKNMRADGFLPKMLVPMFEKFYAYTCAEPAIRHGAKESSSVKQMDAEMIMHIGAALIRYIIERRNEFDLSDLSKSTLERKPSIY